MRYDKIVEDLMLCGLIILCYYADGQVSESQFLSCYASDQGETLTVTQITLIVVYFCGFVDA